MRCWRAQAQPCCQNCSLPTISLRAGLRAVPADSQAVVVMLADQPFVDASVVDGLIDLYERVAWCGAVVSSAIFLLVLVERRSMAENNPFDALLQMDSASEQMLSE